MPRNTTLGVRISPSANRKRRQPSRSRGYDRDTGRDLVRSSNRDLVRDDNHDHGRDHARGRNRDSERTVNRSRRHTHNQDNFPPAQDNRHANKSRGQHSAPTQSVPQRILAVIAAIFVGIKNIIMFVVDIVLNTLRTIASSPLGRLLLLIVAVVIVALAVVTGVNHCSQPATTEQASEESSESITEDYYPDTAALASLQLASTDTTPFTLNQNRADIVPVLSDDQTQAINSATQVLTDQGHTVGFVFINLQTGMGVARDVDTDVYAASSIKGPYAAFVCSLIDQGQISRDTQCANTWVLDEGSSRTESSYSVESLMKDMVEDSNNDALRFLRSAYDSLGFEQYLANMHADVAIAQEAGSFAHYDARNSAIMWMSIYQYITQAETNENAAWLAEMMSSTNLSFVRNATEIDGMEATVYNKGGWCVGENYNSVCDSAIVYENGVPYLLTVMTDAPDGSNNEEAVTNVAAALLNARYSLDDQTAAAFNGSNDAKTALRQGVTNIGSVSVLTD